MGTIITLTTDFGLTDSYVAAMKGVILSINPEAKLVDICHIIPPQNILQAAFILSTAYSFFPQGITHLIVVDPSVGTERRAIILKTASANFVAPDNGVLSYVIEQSSAKPLEYSADRKQLQLGAGLEAVAITRPEFWRSPVSHTFHGRDIFAPVAARLSLGYPATEFGEVITSVMTLPLSHPHQMPGGTRHGNVIHIDNFGNLITNIQSIDLPHEPLIVVEINGCRIYGLSRTYSDSEGLLAFIGSSQYLELALKDGNARAFLNAKIGDEVIIRQGGKKR